MEKKEARNHEQKAKKREGRKKKYTGQIKSEGG